MPRRKQDCPKRMKLEEERRGKAAKSSPDGDNDAEEDDADEGEDDDEEGGDETEVIDAEPADERKPGSVDPSSATEARSEPSRTRATKRDPHVVAEKSRRSKKSKKRVGRIRGKAGVRSSRPSTKSRGDDGMNAADDAGRPSTPSPGELSSDKTSLPVPDESAASEGTRNLSAEREPEPGPKNDIQPVETPSSPDLATPEKPPSPAVLRAKTVSPTSDTSSCRTVAGKRSRGISLSKGDTVVAMEVDPKPKPTSSSQAPAVERPPSAPTSVKTEAETKPPVPGLVKAESGSSAVNDDKPEEMDADVEDGDDDNDGDGDGDNSPLDFSFRREPKPAPKVEPDVPDAPLNLSDGNGDGKSDTPLDLSVPRTKVSSSSADNVSRNRKRAAEMSAKTPDACDEKKKMRPFPVKEGIPWAMNPELTAAISMGLPVNIVGPGLSRNVQPSSPASTMWNGKASHRKSSSHEKSHAEKSSAMDAMSALDSMKALERMQDLSRISSSPQVSQLFGQLGAWHSPWFTQNRSAASAAVVAAAAAAAVSASQDPTTRDILRCVWCHQSFPTFNDLSIHMRDAKHCGPGAPPPAPPSNPRHSQPSPAGSSTNVMPPVGNLASPHRTTPASSSPSPGSPSVPPPVPQRPSGPKSLSVGGGSSSGLSLKETMPLPRKLVRGQDVWLGKGAEQTRQILKCMWCGQSFKSLADMTTHMQQTQHYTNIISQEQIISWKSPEDKASNQSHVSAVLTCKVCNQGFSSLKDLSSHMVKNSHYKEHMMRSISESGSRRRQAREKRKKSLPVRKLLEIERAQSEVRPQIPPPHESPGLDLASRGSSPQGSTSGASGLKFPQARIPCDKCGLKVHAASLFDHLKKCHGSSSSSPAASSDKDRPHPNLLMSALLSVAGNASEEFDKKSLASDPGMSSDSSDVDGGSGHESHRSLRIPTPLKGTSESSKDGSAAEGQSQKTQTKNPSVLNALEKLIEKSFDSNTQRQTGTSALGSSILKRLGIDESVDCTKPLMDPATLAAFSLEHPNALGLSQLAALKGMDPRLGQRKHLAFSPRSVGDDDISDGHESVSDFGTDRDAASSAKEEDDEEEEKKVKKNLLETPVCLKKELPPLRRVGSPVDVKSENSESLRWKGAKAEGKNWQRQLVKHERSISEGAGRNLAEDDPARPKTEVSSLSPRSSSSFHGDDVKSESDSHCHGISDAGSPNGSEHDAEGRKSAPASGGDDDEPRAAKPASSSNPLAALQKLCEKTETNMNRGPAGQGAAQANGSGSGLHGAGLGAAFPGAILAFSWACNDAIVNSDSIMKCAFCDTPFISKGAYRHHLSKMHFVKDGMIPDPFNLKTLQSGSGGSKPPSPGASGSSAASGSGPGGKFPAGGAASPASSSSSSTSPHPQPSASSEDSPHAKFLKYTEMAKQLSSKYV